MSRGLVVNFDDIDVELLLNVSSRNKTNLLYNDKMYPATGMNLYEEGEPDGVKVIITEEFGSDKIFIEVPSCFWFQECNYCKLQDKCKKYKLYHEKITLEDAKNCEYGKDKQRELICINDCISGFFRECIHEKLARAVETMNAALDGKRDMTGIVKPKETKGDLKKLYDKAVEFNIPENVLSYYSTRLTELCKNMDAGDSVKSVFTEHFINGTGAFNIAKKLNTDVNKVKKLINRGIISACIYMQSLHPELMVHIDENTLLCDIGLPISVCKSIDETSLSTLGDIAKLYKEDILSIPKIGKATVQRIIEVLEYGGIKHNLNKDKPTPTEDKIETPIAKAPEDEEPTINWEEKYNELLSQIKSQQEVISNQSRQIQLLQSRVSYKDKTHSTLPIKLEMDELFEDELRYNILNIINFYYKANKDNLGASRVMDIVKAIIEQNPVDDIRGDLKQKLSEAMPDGTFKNNVTPGLLSAIGFDYDKNGDGHYYVYPEGHKEYGHSISATPSDYRTSENQVSNIIKIIFGR